MQKSKLTLVVPTLAVSILLAQPAYSQEGGCTTNEDCKAGMICEQMEMFACPDMPIACEEGADCNLPEIEPCEATTAGVCQFAPCQVDADCGSPHLVCQTQTYDDCGGAVEPMAPCEVGTECPVPEEKPELQDCETVTVSQCAPRYQQECDVDADCGEGFRCVEQDNCFCAGSAPSSDDSAVDPGLPVDDGCSCEPSGIFTCELTEVTCEAASDCPTDWTCDESFGGVSTACSFDSETGERGCEEPEELPPPVNQCFPPYWNEGGFFAGNGMVEAGMAPAANGVEEDGVAGDGEATDEDADQVADAEDEDEDGEEHGRGATADRNDSSHSFSCQVAAGGSSASGLLPLLFLGALVGLARRRSR